MDFPRHWVDVCRERVYVGRYQLPYPAVFEDFIDDRTSVRKGCERVLVGRVGISDPVLRFYFRVEFQFLEDQDPYLFG